MTQISAQTQADPKTSTFDEFIEWYPEDSEVRYELYDGVIIEMPKPRGKHSRLTGSLIEKILINIRETGKGDTWFIPRESIVKPTRERSGYEPDIIVLNQETINTETRWETESIIQNATSVKLIVEVVSSNWRDDYYDKFGDYEEMGILEYWIVDYAALGGRDSIGNHKQPALFVCELVDGEYIKKLFRGSNQIVSSTFPDWKLTAQQVLELSQL